MSRTFMGRYERVLGIAQVLHQRTQRGDVLEQVAIGLRCEMTQGGICGASAKYNYRYRPEKEIRASEMNPPKRRVQVLSSGSSAVHLNSRGIDNWGSRFCQKGNEVQTSPKHHAEGGGV